jgi:DNA-binding NarL/FixJ family response regulator
MPPTTIRILVVDDQRLVRTGLRVILDDEPDFEVVGEAGDGAEAVDLAADLLPDVVLMDIRMPGVDGLAATRQILSRTTTRVVILTTFDADEYVYEALRSGASGFLLKDAEAGQLVGCVRAAANGDAVIDPSVTRRLLDRFATAARPASAAPAELASLTAREQDVLRLVCRGLTNTEIAGELFIEETTVKTHIGRILTKLGVRDRVQAVILGYQTGFALPG